MFNAIADKRQWASAASCPRLYRLLKLCRAFCAEKLRSHHICLIFRIWVCIAVPSLSRHFFTASSKIFTRRVRFCAWALKHRLDMAQLWQSSLSARYTRQILYSSLSRLLNNRCFPPGQTKRAVSCSYWNSIRENAA